MLHGRLVVGVPQAALHRDSMPSGLLDSPWQGKVLGPLSCLFGVLEGLGGGRGIGDENAIRVGLRPS